MSEVCLDPFQKLLEIVLIPSKNLIQWFLWNWNQRLKWQFLKLKVLMQYNLLTLCLIDANMLTDDGREIIEIFVSYCKAIMSLSERKIVSTEKTLWFTACCNLRPDQRREGSFLSAVGVVCPVQCWTDSLCSEPRLQWAYPIQTQVDASRNTSGPSCAWFWVTVCSGAFTVAALFTTLCLAKWSCAASDPEIKKYWYHLDGF